ncbi:MAG: ABC transporter permease [Candidatus Dormibacteraeota bacterium]|nr:ABC transporter permease [Candidatus Dormibacteraeota bacterium]
MSTVAVPVEAAPPAPVEARKSARRERIAVLLRSPTFIVGAILVGVWVVCAIGYTRLAPQDPFATNLLAKLRPPSPQHLFGTDRLGRDVFSRVIAGARGILIVAPVATLLATVLGTAIGLVTGYFGALVDDSVMRLVDAILSVPVIITALLALVALGPSTITVIVVIAVVFAPIIARTVRAAVLTERDQEYVQAAKLRRDGPLYIMFVELLPNVLPPVMVEFTVRLGYAIFTTATLSFLGFGIQPPAPDWGLTMAENYGFVTGGFWWPVLFPAIAIASLVVGVNLLSDAVSQALER